MIQFGKIVNFFKKKENLKKSTGVHPATLNWFIHVLVDNVGYVRWIRRTRKEQEIYDKEHDYNKGYPYKTVEYPIPAGKNIVLKESGTMRINCDSEKTRNLIIEMARSYTDLEKKYYYGLRNKQSGKWIEVENIPAHSSVSSAPDRLTGLVYSPILNYLGGAHMGFRTKGKWFVILKNKAVEHKVTHFRYLPPGPVEKTVDYEENKTEIERLRSYLK